MTALIQWLGSHPLGRPGAGSHFQTTSKRKQVGHKPMPARRSRGAPTLPYIRPATPRAPIGGLFTAQNGPNWLSGGPKPGPKPAQPPKTVPKPLGFHAHQCQPTFDGIRHKWNTLDHGRPDFGPAVAPVGLGLSWVVDEPNPGQGSSGPDTRIGPPLGLSGPNCSSVSNS